MKTVKLGPFKGGINNVAPEHKLPDDPSRGIYHLRDAVNVDITNTGTLKRRAGYAVAWGGANITSAWSTGATAYAVDSGTLYRLAANIDGMLSAQPVLNAVGADFNSGAWFVDTFAGVVVSDGTELFRIVADELRLTYLNVPSPVPVTTSASTVVTQVIDGIESLPSSPYIGVVGPAVRTYTTKEGGTTYYLGGSGAPLTTLELIPMVAGKQMAIGFGRLWVVNGSVVYFSEPFRLNALHPSKGFIPFESDVLVFAPVTHGFVVATADEIGFIRNGAPDEFSYASLASYGAVAGTAAADYDGGVFIMSKRGVVKVSQSGDLVNVHEGKVSVDLSDTGVSGIMEADGMSKLVVSLYNSELSRSAATSFMDAEIIRKGLIQ